MSVLNIDKPNLISNKLSQKISQKKFLLQFLPTILENISESNFIFYKSKKLKSAYLIDIVNNLILKYYFKKENRFVLNSTVLKDKYGYLYNYYIDYLKSIDILNLVLNYKKGFSSRVYSLNDSIFNDKIKRYKNYDKVLIKKYKNKIFNTVDLTEDSSFLIEKEIKEKLILDLFSVDVDMDRSIYFLDALKSKDLDIYNRNMYSVDCINNKHIFYHFDNFGRFHTNFTILRSFIRKNCLLIDGEETYEIDINNSQPLFLTKLIFDSQSNWIDIDEFNLFKQLTISGNYYQYFMQATGINDKKKIKELTYKVLFGRNASSSKSDKFFKQVFPTIYNFICLYKKENNDYKVLAYDLQKAESNLLFNKIIKNIKISYPYIKVITVHDSIIIQKKYKDIVETMFKNELIYNFNF